MRPNTESWGQSVREYEAARLAADVCDGSTFMDRVLCVDLVGRTSSQDGHSVDGDPKSSVFVGNLDFGSKEEDLRVFFETLVTGERGSPADNDEQDGDVKLPMWVTRVRIVRDKESQLGKGFAYVQFAVGVSFHHSFAQITYRPSRTDNVLMRFWRWKKQSSNSPNASCVYNAAKHFQEDVVPLVRPPREPRT